MKLPIGYYTWSGMKARCLNPKHKNYLQYGGAGITVCDKWMTWSGFYEDMGERPEGKTLDRINGKLGYTKSNCRWATKEEQIANRKPQKSSAVSDTHGINQRTKGCFAVALSVKNSSRYFGSRHTLEEAKELRDECFYEREFQRLALMY